MRQVDYLANSGTVFVKVGLSSSSLLLLFCVHICCILYIWIMSWSAGQLYKTSSQKNTFSTDVMHHAIHYNIKSIQSIIFTNLDKGIKFVHFFDVLPKMCEFLRNVKIFEVFTRDSNMLQFWHQFAIKAAKCITRQKSRSLFR